MSPIDKIRAGIVNLDWDIVAEGFGQLTGEIIELGLPQDPQPRKKAAKKKAAKKKAAKRKSTKRKATKRADDSKGSTIIESGKGFMISSRFQPDNSSEIRFQGNNFVSEPGIKENLTPEEKEVLNKLQSSIAKKEEYQPVVVQCRVCKQQVETNPALVTSASFICDRCLDRR